MYKGSVKAVNDFDHIHTSFLGQDQSFYNFSFSVKLRITYEEITTYSWKEIKSYIFKDELSFLIEVKMNLVNKHKPTP